MTLLCSRVTTVAYKNNGEQNWRLGLAFSIHVVQYQHLCDTLWNEVSATAVGNNLLLASCWGEEMTRLSHRLVVKGGWKERLGSAGEKLQSKLVCRRTLHPKLYSSKEGKPT